MQPEEFIKTYETALATQDWNSVEPLIAKSASITFSNGTVHIGKDRVQLAFENNFRKIKNEDYSISQVNWITKDENFAVYLFEFNWTGLVNDSLVSGSGIGTSVIIKESGKWKLLTEHLGRKSD